MPENNSLRPWVPQPLIKYYEEQAVRYRRLAPHEFEGEVPGFAICAEMTTS